jgi:hypothetical protein
MTYKETRFNCRINTGRSVIHFHDKNLMFYGNQVVGGALSNVELIDLLSFLQLNYSSQHKKYAGTKLILKEIKRRHIKKLYYPKKYSTIELVRKYSDNMSY